MPQKDIVISPAAEKEIKKLPKHGQKTVIKYLERYAENSEAASVEKIRSKPGYYRLRAGEFRIVFHKLTPERLVVLLVRDRKDAYKGLNALDSRLESVCANLEAQALRQLPGGVAV